MFVVDFTRIDDEVDFDLIVGKDGGTARDKAINYIMNYAFANDGIYLDKKILDANFEPNDFSYKLFMQNVYGFNTNSDLITSGFYTDKDYSVFLKYVDINKIEDNYIYSLHNDLEKSAPKIFALLVNDRLIRKYADDLNKYKEIELDPNSRIDTFKMDGIKASVISLYNGGLFLEELLNNAISYKQAKGEDIEEIPL